MLLRQKLPALILTIFLLGLFPVSGWGSPEELKEASALNEQVGQLALRRALPTGFAAGSEGLTDPLQGSGAGASGYCHQPYHFGPTVSGDGQPQ